MHVGLQTHPLIDFPLLSTHMHTLIIDFPCLLTYVELYTSTVKPVLMATCIQRPHVLKGHPAPVSQRWMSQRCLRDIF